MKKPMHLLLFAAIFLAPMGALSQSVAMVTSEKDNAITIVNLKDQKVEGIIPTCKRPRHMQLSPDRKQLMVACSGDNVADIIDLTSRKSVGRIPLGDDPEMFDVSPDGKTIFASNEDDGEVSFVDISTKKVLKGVKVGKEPEGVRVSLDGKTLYVSSEVASMVHVVDIATASVTKNIPVGKRPRRFALTPNGAELWVTNELGASVSIISTKEMKVLSTIKFAIKGAKAADITPVGITMSKDGKRAFVGLGKGNHVAFIDVDKREVTSQVLAGKRAWNLTLNKDESKLYVINGLSDDMTIIDTGTAKAIKTIAVGRVPHTVVLVD